MLLKFLCEKLVRDKTVERYQNQGGSLEFRTLETNAEYSRELNKKLIEEAKEVVVAQDREELVAELADVHEVLLAIAQFHKIQAEEIELSRQEKFSSRGGYAKRIYSSIGTVPEGTPLAGYILASPQKYLLIKPPRLSTVLASHDISWKQVFNEAKSELLKTMPEDIVSTTHIGSTSIQGYPAQPVVDVLIGVYNLLEFDLNIHTLVRLGWFALGEQGINNRRVFVKLDAHNQNEIVRIHCFEYTDSNLKKFAQFKTLLKANEALQKEFTTLRQNLLSNETTTYESYNQAKEEFINAINSTV